MRTLAFDRSNTGPAAAGPAWSYFMLEQTNISTGAADAPVIEAPQDLNWILAGVCAHRDQLLKAMRDIRDCAQAAITQKGVN
jgi:hypothetical protein